MATRASSASQRPNSPGWDTRSVEDVGLAAILIAIFALAVRFGRNAAADNANRLADNEVARGERAFEEEPPPDY